MHHPEYAVHATPNILKNTGSGVDVRTPLPINIFHTSVTIFSNNCMILLNIHKLLSILTLKDKNILVVMVCESEHTLHWNSTTLPSNETKYIVNNQVLFGILASGMMPIQL